MVSIQNLGKFIDSFNFSAVKVGQLIQKNDSYEMTHVMTMNTRKSLADNHVGSVWQDKPEDEQKLLKLLSLVSFKIHERFRNMREAFRQIDSDHSQSISLNEFAQAIDFFRLKIDFKDIQVLFRFMDSDGDGEVGFDEFTLLNEEKWRNMDPYTHYKKGILFREEYVKTESNRGSCTSMMKNTKELGFKVSDSEGYTQLENLSKEHLKIPVKK